MNRLTRVSQASRAQDTNTRLQAALAAGTDPTPQDVGALIAQCATEPDFFVRDMLTWALTRHPAGTIVRQGTAAIDTLVTMVVEGDHDAAEAVAGLTSGQHDGNDSARAEVVHQLLATVTPAATVEQRLRIVQALGDLPGDAAHEALTRLAADPDPRVAGTARHLGH